MSKRYGRNQKRRHREEISLLRVETGRLQKVAEGHKKEADAHKIAIDNIVYEIKNVVNNSSILPPEKFRTEIAPPEVWRIPKRMPLYLYDISTLADKIPQDLAMSVIDTYQLRVVIENKKEEFQKRVHLIFESPSGKYAAYYISEDALSTKNDYTLRFVVEGIAKQLFSEVSK